MILNQRRKRGREKGERRKRKLASECQQSGERGKNGEVPPCLLHTVRRAKPTVLSGKKGNKRGKRGKKTCSRPRQIFEKGRRGKRGIANLRTLCF